MFLLSVPQVAFGEKVTQKGADGFNPTFHVDLNFGFTTHRSKYILQNDRGTFFSYKISGNAGAFREYGFYTKMDSTTVAFELNTSEITASWRDTGFRYRFWTYVYVGVVLSQLEMQTNNQGTDEIDAQGYGFGGNAGFFIPFGRDGVMYMDIVSSSISTMTNALTGEVTVDGRTDIDIGAGIDITKRSFDFIFGYRQRTYTINFNSVSSAEENFSTYVGLRWSSIF